MKTLLLFSASLLLSVASLGQETTTYVAVNGSIHPYPSASATLALGNNPATAFNDYAFAEYGSGVNFLNYYLADGTSAKDLKFSSGTTVTLPGYRTYRFSGNASGLDSTNEEVKVFITWKYHVDTSRYGGLRFDSGSMSVTK